METQQSAIIIRNKLQVNIVVITLTHAYRMSLARY